MILHPGILALVLVSGIICLIVVFSAGFGVRILRSWDLQSGSARQLRLERSTYLVSTFLSHVFGLQLVSFFLFIFIVDRIHVYFTGAMCAAGVLHVNPYGYPALILKIANFLLSGLWLIMNALDNQGPDYPLIRKKYLFLVLLAPFVIVETYLLGKFVAGLNVEVITSCCGSLFSIETKGLASDLAALPSVPTKVAFFSRWFSASYRDSWLPSAARAAFSSPLFPQRPFSYRSPRSFRLFHPMSTNFPRITVPSIFCRRSTGI